MTLFGVPRFAYYLFGSRGCNTTWSVVVVCSRQETTVSPLALCARLGAHIRQTERQTYRMTRWLRHLVAVGSIQVGHMDYASPWIESICMVARTNASSVIKCQWSVVHKHARPTMHLYRLDFCILTMERTGHVVLGYCIAGCSTTNKSTSRLWYSAMYCTASSHMLSEIRPTTDHKM